MAQRNGVAAIGECMLELSAKDDFWRMGHAGDTFNTLWALRALLPAEHGADYVTAFGDDPFSRQQIGFMQDAGIGIAASPKITGARPGLYAITLDGIERSFTYWRGDSAARRLADDPAALAKSLENQSLVYFSGITLAILADDARATLFAALRTARQAGALIAFDPNYRPRLWGSPNAVQQAFAKAFAVTDIALPTFDDEHGLHADPAPSKTARRIHAAGVNEIVVKNGGNPALLSIGGKSGSVPASDMDDAVDTTGAGDGFNGGYLAARLLGMEPAEAVKSGHRVAAAVVRVRGALAPIENLRDAFQA